MKWLSIYTTPRMSLVLLLGALSGLPLALTASTASIWLTEAGVSKAAIGFFAMVGTPYALKFLWAPLVDHLQLPVIGALGRRRSWLLLSQLALACALLGMAVVNPATHTVYFGLLALCVAIASATQDIAIDEQVAHPSEGQRVPNLPVALAREPGRTRPPSRAAC